MTRHPIFVYGTLRWQCGNDRLWHGRATSHYDGVAHVVGYALVNSGGFPYMIPAATGQVVGALIVPDDGHYEAVLARMDALEGYRPDAEWNHYYRVTVPVLHHTSITVAWTYVPDDIGGRIATLPDVPTNQAGFYDWRLASRHTTGRNTR